MSHILHIFRKDAIRLWPQISAFLALLALRGWLDRRYAPYDPPQPLSILPVLLPIACSVLLIALIHEEGLVGDRKYWLSRPIGRRELVAAKILFVLAFVNLPLCLYQAATILAAGLPLSQNWLNLLCLQLFFSAVDILPLAALAAVTKNMVQTIMMALASVTATIVVSSLDWSWNSNAPNGLSWIDQTLTGAIFASVSIAALALQYMWRATALARWAIAGGVVLTVVSSSIPYAAKWAIQERLSAQPVDPSAIRIAWNPEDAPMQRLGDRVWTGPGDLVQIRMPVRIDDLPPGVTVQFDAIEPVAEGANGMLWQPGWIQVESFIGGKTGSIAAIYVPRKFFVQVKDAPIRLHGIVDLTALRIMRTYPLPLPHRVEVAGIGNCASYPAPGPPPGPSRSQGSMLACNATLPSAGLVLVRDGTRLGSVSETAPYATSPGYSPLKPTFLVSFPDAGLFQTSRPEVHVELQKPVAYIQRPFDFQNIRLSDYALEAPGQRLSQ